MLESIVDNVFKYIKISPADQKKRRILARLKGIIADSENSTRNGRLYNIDLWERVFDDPIMQEKIDNRVCVGEFEHPTDGRESIDPEKIAICLAEKPKKDKAGNLIGIFDVLDTPCGQILKTLLDYGANIGVSSRGSGDTFVDRFGQETVDPESYNCICWDAVLMPAVKTARLKQVTESLNTNHKKSLTEALSSLVENASEKDAKTMKDVIDNLDLDTEDEIKDTLNDESDESSNFLDMSKENLNIEETTYSIGDNLKTEYIITVTDPEIEDIRVLHILDSENHLITFDSNEAAQNWIDNDFDKYIFYIKFDSELYCNLKPEFNDLDSPQEISSTDSDVNYINDLQEAYRAKQKLESTVLELQEKLSLCYTKESSLNESLSKASDLKNSLSNEIKQLRPLKNRVKTLEEDLKSKEDQIISNKSYTESLKEVNNNLTTRVNKLVDSKKELLENLKEKNFQLKSLQENSNKQTSSYKKKLQENLSLVENYKKVSDKAISKYIDILSVNLGISKDTFYKKLPNNYTFKDIDNLYESLQSFSLNTTQLPFRIQDNNKSLNESIEKKIDIRQTKKDSIQKYNNPAFQGLDDDIDIDLLKKLNFNI